MINAAWIGTGIAVIAGIAGIGVSFHKVRTHDKILFKEKGGLNLVDVDSCRDNMQNCHDKFTKEVGEIVEEKLKEHREKSINKEILNELKKLNGSER